MDVLAHGFWGGAAFGRKDKKQWRWAFLVGTLPDVIAFGPFLLSQIGSTRWVDFPDYVHRSYDVTHSLVVWAAVTSILWVTRKRFPWVLGPWALHILCDIPTHALDFFPTPYLWPLSTPLYPGTPWARPVFMLGNYVALAVTYAVVFRGRRIRSTSPN